MKNRMQTVFLICILFTGCTASIAHTDLTAVQVDEIHLYDAVTTIDCAAYTPSDRFTVGENTTAFEQLHITQNEEGEIIAITANFADTAITIGGEGPFYRIDAIAPLLGEQYKESWQDKEQYLKKLTYRDHTANIQASFVYNGYTGDLVWLILEQYQ